MFQDTPSGDAKPPEKPRHRTHASQSSAEILSASTPRGGDRGRRPARHAAPHWKAYLAVLRRYVPVFRSLGVGLGHVHLSSCCYLMPFAFDVVIFVEEEEVQDTVCCRMCGVPPGERKGTGAAGRGAQSSVPLAPMEAWQS